MPTGLADSHQIFLENLLNKLDEVKERLSVRRGIWEPKAYEQSPAFLWVFTCNVTCDLCSVELPRRFSLFASTA